MRWSAAAVLLLLAGPALAGGARYLGPTADIDPRDRLPTDIPPPDTGGSGPTPPEGWVALHRAPRVSPGSWRFAWHMRENAVVEARAAVVRTGLLPVRAIEERILPALRGAAADEALPADIHVAAVLGLVRIGDGDSLALLRSVALNKGTDQYHKRVEEAGVLGLGLLDGDPPGNGPILRAIADDPGARYRSRAFACVALGMIEKGRPSLETLRTLEGRLFDEDHLDAAVSAAFSLGFLESAEAAGILQRLLDLPEPSAKERRAMGSEWRGPLLLSHAAAALGRSAGACGDPEVAADALRTLERVYRHEGGLPTQGAVLGLGALGVTAGARTAGRCVRLLVPLLESEMTEPQVRRFAALALARIAARGPEPARSDAMVAIRWGLANGEPARSWAALAAGIAGEGSGEEERSALAQGVLRLWEAPLPEGASAVEVRGGCLVALGLLREASARPLLERVLVDGDEDRDLRGYAATALGLLGDGGAIPSLRAVLADPSERSWRRPVVVALGLLGDSESVPAIVSVLVNPKSSQHTLGGCVQALGFLRDQNAVEVLLEVASNENFPDLTRAMVHAALARMAAGARPDPFADLAEDAPYRSWTDAMGELWSIL